jgi:biotin carboxylase
MEVSHDGGVFRTKTLGRYSDEYKSLEKVNDKVLKSFGLVNGATHTEFIRSKENGKWYFLETSSRVGGAHIPDLVEASTGINLWREWAKIENTILKNEEYTIAKSTDFSAGLIIALAKDKVPNHEIFQSEEVVKFLPLDYHVGIVYKSNSAEKIQERLDESATLIIKDFLNIIPPKSKPSS